MTSRIPHLLEPYLPHLPQEATLVVLTSVLGASTNWLVLRHLHALLKPSSASQNKNKNKKPTPLSEGGRQAENEHDDEQQEEVAVLLLSFLRDLPFWRENLSRLGIDLEAAARRGRFGFVDGLGGLFSPGNGQQPQSQQQQPQSQPQQPWNRALTSAAPGDIGRVVLEGVEQLKTGSSSTAGEGRERKVVLVIDGLDFVLAALDPRLGQGAGDSSGAAAVMKDMLMELREKTHAAIVTLAADDPLIKEQETTLEKQHAWFALSLAHEADMVLSLRLLDTGAAKDVSGVIRITHGGARAKDHEYLYHVGGDGGVRVFERGQ
ncbi:hypothetical protein C8A01DRAFT_45997 [Parachaetomium inaequale]|uniref:Uncharacterized protein n=1 Tax=Parachaetomium inaequale TaxID=2588326 RepID=A0AAN6PKC0_9PEZI|nr:hypothetical protein C8A01DRAFT_45997 [Parachaetomium inaequale]